MPGSLQGAETVKRHCRRDKGGRANKLAAEAKTAARQGNLKTLYHNGISKNLKGRLQNKSDQPNQGRKAVEDY